MVIVPKFQNRQFGLLGSERLKEGCDVQRAHFGEKNGKTGGRAYSQSKKAAMTRSVLVMSPMGSEHITDMFVIWVGVCWWRWC
jgi:hypothetical protein